MLLVLTQFVHLLLHFVPFTAFEDSGPSFGGVLVGIEDAEVAAEVALLLLELLLRHLQNVCLDRDTAQDELQFAPQAGEQSQGIVQRPVGERQVSGGAVHHIEDLQFGAESVLVDHSLVLVSDRVAEDVDFG